MTRDRSRYRSEAFRKRFDDDDSDSVPVVPFVPWRCPRCGDAKPFTYGHRGTLRWHLCQGCNTRYRSRELTESEMPGWIPAPPDSRL